MDVVKHTFNDFIEETLIRFKYYHLQCEEAWLEEVNDPAEGPKVPPVFRLSIDQGEKIEEIVKKQIKNIRTATSVDGQFEESTTGVPEYASMEGECEESDMLPCNVAALLSMSEEEFEDYVAKCNLMASKYVTSCKEEGKIWFKLFKKHAAKVKELYTG
ncbi:Protein of unknown function [Gryllus bimaculatus]|nr:Protein of unknown function [Gryllus bimaculatus]